MEEKEVMGVRILKGTRQIGGCITEIQSKQARILIDFGEDLDDEKKKKVPQMEGLTCGEPAYDAVFITHSHQDHIGLIDQILPEIPVYVEEKSKKIYELTCAFTGKKCRENIQVVMPKKGTREYETISVKDMSIQYYIIDHSAYNSAMLLLTCEGKRILHTGDFRSHGYKGKDFVPTLRRIREQGKIDCLITEGTVLEREDVEYEKEEELKEKAVQVFQQYNQVFVLQSSTNIDRLTSFCKASFATQKKFIEDVFTANITLELGGRIPNPKFDHHKVSVWEPERYASKSIDFKEKYINPLKKYKWIQNVQGDYCMTVKTSMYEDIQKLVRNGRVKKACLVYSMWHGYLDKPETKEFVEKVKALGIDFVELHTSGHADLKTMKKVDELLEPSKVVVMHTTKPEKANEVFKRVVTIQDGERITVQKGMEVKEFIRRYLAKEGYFYRLRGTPGKEEMLVYYEGVKIFELKQGRFFVPSIKFYLPNSKNNQSKTLPEQVVEDYNNMKGENTVFTIEHKGKFFQDYAEFYTYIMKPQNYENRQDAEFVGKDIGSITEKEIEKIEEILERRIGIYSNKEADTRDFGPTTKDEKGKREKEYQLKIMNILNDKKEKAKILPNQEVFTANTVPFEMEYGIKTRERKEKLRQKGEKAFLPEGRIDNVFIDGKTVNLVEIKIGTAVIAGNNGIHKHLIDIAQCCAKHSMIEVEDFQQLIQEKGKILEYYGWKNRMQEKVERLEYNIICGYGNEDEKQDVVKLLNRIYEKNMEQVILMTSKDGVLSESTGKKEKVRMMKQNYGTDLVGRNIPQLLELVEDKCPTKIYLANEDYTRIEPYNYEEK